MKLCIDCAYHKPDAWAHLDKCANQTYKPPIDPVRGRTGLPYCDELRRIGQKCGPDGDGFEAKAREEL